MHLHPLRYLSKGNSLASLSHVQIRWTSTKVSRPLRILFCGSDEMSSTCLRALHEEQKRDPVGINSIDVLIRPAKPFGRGLKEVRDVPIRAVAQELGLAIHERDTFTGWDLPTPYGKPINLIVAVCFGLFVPPRILKSAYYGGINVHPSILPQYRGPSPIRHVLMSGDKFTGVTLQTLDDKAFDHGTILAQTTQFDSIMPDMHSLNYSQLVDRMTPMAAEQLVHGIRNRVFVPPLVGVGWFKSEKRSLVHAHKFTKDDQELHWNLHANVIERQHRALGRLWNEICIDRKETIRVIFNDINIVPLPPTLAVRLRNRTYTIDGRLRPHALDEDVRFLAVRDWKDIKSWKDGKANGHAEAKILFFIEDRDAIIIATGDTTAIRVQKMTVAGKNSEAAAKVVKHFRDTEGMWKLRKHGRYQTRAYPAKLTLKGFGVWHVRLPKRLRVQGMIPPVTIHRDDHIYRTIHLTGIPKPESHVVPDS